MAPWKVQKKKKNLGIIIILGIILLNGFYGFCSLKIKIT